MERKGTWGGSDETLHQEIEPTAEEPIMQPMLTPDDIARHQRDEGKADGDAKAVDQPCHNTSRPLVSVPISGAPLGSGHRADRLPP